MTQSECEIGGTASADDIAELLGISDRRVRQFAGQGIFPKASHGQYEIRGCIRGYVDFLKGRAPDSQEKSKDPRHRLISARADLAELNAAEASGALVRLEDVENSWTEIVARFRQRALAIATKAAPLVAVERETDTCHDIIETYVHEALAELAGSEIVERPGRTGDGGQIGDDDGGPPAEADGL